MASVKKVAKKIKQEQGKNEGTCGKALLLRITAAFGDSKGHVWEVTEGCAKR